MWLRIPRESFIVFPTSSTLNALRGGLGAPRDGGVVDGDTPALAVGVNFGGKG